MGGLISVNRWAWTDRGTGGLTDLFVRSNVSSKSFKCKTDDAWFRV